MLAGLEEKRLQWVQQVKRIDRTGMLRKTLDLK
jgi:hypothetical protein